MEEVVTMHERVAWEELFPFLGRRGRTLPCPVDAYRSALRDAQARVMFDEVRAARGWICYTCASTEVMVMSARPQTDPCGALDLVDALLTPAQFARLAGHARAHDTDILAALRDYLTLLHEGRRDCAAALVGAAVENEREAVSEVIQ